MTLEHWYFLSQIVAATFIVTSVGFLAYQTRQNTKAVQAASVDAWTRSHMSFAEDIYRDPDLARIMKKSDKEFEDLEDIDRFRSLFIAYRNQISAIRLFQLYREGLVSDQEWEELGLRWRAIGERQNMQMAWRQFRHLYGSDSQIFFDRFFGSEATRC